MKRTARATSFAAQTLTVLFWLAASLPLAPAARVFARELPSSQSDAATDSDVEELRRLLDDEDATRRNIAALDLVRAGSDEADRVIIDILQVPLSGSRERAAIALLEVIRVRGAVRFVPEVLELGRQGNGTSPNVR